MLAIPLVTKGRGQAENSNVDMNYFLGIRDSDDVLVADFEAMTACGASPAGQNYPVAGTTVIADNLWYHAAATFDGTTWRLYLNGSLENSLVVNCQPRSDSIQHAGLGTAMNSTGVTEGHFDGVLDEVRIWNHARSQAEILAAINSQITTATTGLVGRWALDEGSGTTVYGSAGTSVDGTIMGSGHSWVSGAPFNITPPAQYTLTVNTTGSGSVTLSPSGGTYNAGTLVQLTAVPATDWVFTGWSGDLSGAANPATLTMDANKTVTATFAEGSETTLTFQEGAGGYAGTVDTFLYAGGADTSYGAFDYIKWDTSGTVDPNPAGIMYGLLRFEDIFGTNPGQVPSGATVTSAILTYEVWDVGDPATVNEVAVAWDETTTYNGFGGESGVQADEYGAQVGTASGDPAGSYTLDVTASLSAWAGSPGSNQGWIFRPTDTNGVQVRSSEYTTSAQRPKLQVTYIALGPSQPRARPAGARPAPGECHGRVHLADPGSDRIRCG